MFIAHLVDSSRFLEVFDQLDPVMNASWPAEKQRVGLGGTEVPRML